MRILLVDDEPTSRESVADFLGDLGHQTTQCENGQEALSLLSSTPFPMVISDIYMPQMSGLDLLKKVKQMPQGEHTDFVILTGQGDIRSAVDALRHGAYEYLQKPLNIAELAAMVDRIAEHQTLLAENYVLTTQFEEKVQEVTKEVQQELSTLRQAYAESVGAGKVLVARSSAMKQVLYLADKFHGDRSIPVLIEGETGTGKEIIARRIHYGQGKPAGPLVEINCSAISGDLFENELFGHEAASFTGADKKGMKGKLEIAKGGTLFLDEIGDMPPSLQPKLLRVLQEKEFYRVGGTKKIRADIRIMCATNKDLWQMVKKGLFREDLYYRLNVGHIIVPPLRDRKEEIRLFAEIFLKEYVARKRRSAIKLSEAAFQRLEAHDWPGNVRELQNVIERTALLHEGETITAGQINFFEGRPVETTMAQSVPPALSLDPLILQPGKFRLPSDRLNIIAINEEIIKKALEMHQGNKTHTAAYLGISRHVLLTRIRHLRKL